MRMGLEEPELACGPFHALPRTRGLVCAYADNQSHPSVSGELHHWTASGARSKVLDTSSAISALAVTASDVVVLGTEHGEVLSIGYDGEWRRLAKFRHEVAVVTVACSAVLGLGCSVSRDGLILIWRLHDGARRFATSIDVEPLQAGFSGDGTRISVIDVRGTIHAWEFANPFAT